MSAIAIGLMSGTSQDGISASLVIFKGRHFSVLAHRTTPYPPKVARLLQQGQTLTARSISSLNMMLGDQFARAALSLLREARIPSKQVSVIGSHGHTIYHGPRDYVPSTLQIGEPSVIAERVGIPVVANFRARDIALGGEGAPLVCCFDKAFFGAGGIRALQNVGGIANVTAVGKRIDTIAFDTGPGNCLIDLAAQRMSRGQLRCDLGGQLAKQGRIDKHAIARLWSLSYFRRPPPKSTGRELFNEGLIRRIFGARLNRAPRDVLATLTYFTAYSIAQGYRRFIPHHIEEIIVSGGGVRNRTLMQHLRALLRPTPVRSIVEYGIPTQAKETAAFAFLALRAIRGKPNHLPPATGAGAARILGTITPGHC